jgi:enoyl-CoA hydratase/carnithine racemase
VAAECCRLSWKIETAKEGKQYGEYSIPKRGFAAELVINRPQALNALNSEILNQLN